MKDKYTEDYMRWAISKSDEWLSAALKILYKKQTPQEQQGEHPNTINGVGFNRFDAKSGGRYAIKIIKGWKLNNHETGHARKIIAKYIKQLTKIANKEL